MGPRVEDYPCCSNGSLPENTPSGFPRRRPLRRQRERGGVNVGAASVLRWARRSQAPGSRLRVLQEEASARQAVERRPVKKAAHLGEVVPAPRSAPAPRGGVRRANQDSKAARVGAPLSLILGFVGLGSHAQEVEVGSEAGDAEDSGSSRCCAPGRLHRVSSSRSATGARRESPE
jgi:hypothetical protein